MSRFDEQGKLFWLYINQRCEISGVHQVHYPVDSAYLGFKVDNEFIQSFLHEINKDNQRLIRLESRRLWITEYVRHQQKPKGGALSEKSGPHIKVVRELKKHGVFDLAVDNDPELFENYINRPQRQEIPYQYPTDSLSLPTPKGYGSGDGRSAGNGDGSDRGPSPSKSSNLARDVDKIREAIKKVLPAPAGDIDFEEDLILDKAIRKRLLVEREPPELVEQSLIQAVKAKKMEAAETGAEFDLIQCLEVFNEL